MDRSWRRAVLEGLSAVEETATRPASPLSARLARTHLKTITDGWRELLGEHQPDRKGRCPVCSGWLRRRRWPCQVWVTAHEHLIGDGSDTARSPVTTSTPPRPPRRVEVIPRQVDAPTAADHVGPCRPNSGGQNGTHRTGGPAAQEVPRPSVPDNSVPDISVPGNTEIHRAATTGRQPTLPRHA